MVSILLKCARLVRVGPCARDTFTGLRSIGTTLSDFPAPPLLLKLRGDMKAAMKAKDTNR